MANEAHNEHQAAPLNTDVKVETLIVISKVKTFIKEQAGFNSSQCAIDALTQEVASACLRGIEKARKAGRKTVMGKDITTI